jgi:TonB family protein
MLAISLAAHLAVFLLVALLQWTPMQRPMSSHEVTIVSLQEPRVRTHTPVTHQTPAPVTPQAQRDPVMPPAPPRAADAAPPPPASKVQPAAAPLLTRPRTMRELLGQDMPAPPPASKVEPSKPDDSVRHLMQEVQLPPEAPRLGEQVPSAGAPVKSAKAMESSVKNLVVPTAPRPAVHPPTTPDPAAPATLPPVPAPSLKSLVTQELQKPMVSPKASPPVVAGKAPTADLQKPTLAIHSQSAAPGQSRYLAIVQQRISQNWTPPAVEMNTRSLHVRVKFRLAASGQVTSVTVEQSSGLSYYDLAGQRAVLSSVPLPPFPSDLKELWLDVHVSFTVGEGAG